MITSRRDKNTVFICGLVVLVVFLALPWLCAERLRFLVEFEILGRNDQGYREYRQRATGIVFVRVPGGTFLMGSRVHETGETAETPLHEVTLRPFLIAKFEVSQAQWEQVTGQNLSGFRGDELPAEQLSWESCQEYRGRQIGP